MKPNYLIVGFLFAVLFSFAAQAGLRRAIAAPAAPEGGVMNLKWIAYYGSALKSQDVKNVDWAIVDRGIDPSPLKNGHTKFIAYVSVGEAEEHRDYWSEIKNSKALIAPNPNWKGAHLIDVRDVEWRKLILEKILPMIKAKGFDGVFLDTIDTAIDLEDTDAQKYAGCKDVVVELISEMRAHYPDFLIIPNGGLRLLPRFAPNIDGVLVEDLYTHYDFKKKKSFRTEATVTEAKEKILDGFRKEFGKPVLNLLYDTAQTTSLARFAIRRSQDKNYTWYLTTVDLMKIGVVNP